MIRTAACLAFAAALAYAPPAHAQATMKVAFFACKNESELDRGNRIRRSNDNAALKQWVLGVVTSGACVWLPAGSPIYRDGRAASSDNVKIRPKGEITSYFTMHGAISER